MINLGDRVNREGNLIHLGSRQEPATALSKRKGLKQLSQGQWH